MKKIFFFVAFAFSGFIFSNQVLAQDVTFENPVFNAEYNINNDSTFTVKETILYRAFGDFNGLRRDIPLENSDLRQNCINNPNLTCGGFDRIIPIAVYDYDGRKLGADEYSTYEIENEDNGSRYFRFEREFYRNGRQVSGEEFGWIIEYKIFGGIQWIGSNPYFYWNSLPEDRSGQTLLANVKLNFPSTVALNIDNLTLFDEYSNQTIQNTINSISIRLNNIGSRGNFTLAYKFNPNEITKPGILRYNILSPFFGNSVYLDNVKIEEASRGILDYIPAGSSVLKFSHPGYVEEIRTINIESGKESVVEVNLQPQPAMSVLLIIHTLIVIFGLFLIPTSILFVVFYYLRKGRDKNPTKSIIPLYEPPTDVRPYLLGSIKDESVDKVDITGSIIDLAYRGFIKIKEKEKEKNYLLTRLEGKEGEVLNSNETFLLDSLFGSKSEVETKELSTTFYLKYKTLQSKIYGELVEKGFFNRSPETVRATYFGCGFFLALMGLVIFVFGMIFLTDLIGYLVLLTPALALLTMGLSYLIAAKFMPAKTALGSKVFGEILGFKMYLNTAERFRLQKLGPDEFERYLSYAIVFGIEREWAKKFEGIYNQVPDWYEGSSTGDIWTAVWVSSLIRNFSDTTNANIVPATSSTGGGWSGSSGSFGGFSGGGGGGGSSGGW